MMNIGDFARRAGLSVRMLRHYDALGLLAPERVDPVTGYRSYSAAQFPRINRLVALKELGFGLDEVGRILDGGLPADELREMLRLRQGELEARVDADRRRLADVAGRLRAIEGEGRMSDLEYTEKHLPAVRLAALVETVPDVESIAAVVGPMFPRVSALLARAGAPVDAPPLATYDEGADGGIRVTVGWPTVRDSLPGLEVVDLTPTPGLTTLYEGAMTGIGVAWQSLAGEAEQRGAPMAGPCREVYLHTPDGDQTDWITELQQPIG
ncbi:MerR family transcriptional regulator [Nocardioides acrostichi]|uniref:MerR family transcriptional regulator n=1 Tax=Nocardioides acrostichi TaxID=2784339 RepID=A0A930Y5Q8_9ACTN|nr:MerR family transcriptional regulator [Nocardioides acrostichi]MBF4161510.1 MerR family transcriptional regulator [Nocardioides acrostichi]